MTNDLIQIRLPHDMRIQAEAVFSGIGMKTPEAIRVFLQQCINSNGLPFQPSAKTPNIETLAAMQEIEDGKATKTGLAALRERAARDALS